MRWHAFAVAGLLTTLPVIVLDPAWGDQAELPRIFLDTTYAPPTTGITITVNAGDDLQAALDQAHPGDIIELHAGATFTGNFILPNKPGTGWIYIRSSAHASLPTPGMRVSPAQANLMPKIVTPNTAPAISTASAAHHYRFVGIEITGTHATTASTLFNLVRLEDQAGQGSLSQVPTDIVFDRCYIHGTPTGNVRRGVDLSSARAAVIDSYLSDFHEVGADSQALAGFNWPGPFKIVNNHLEGSRENVMFGGIDPSIPDLVPSDIEIRHNYFVKPLSWRIEDPSYGGTPWTVKNLFELKNARRVLIEGNVFEHNWAHAQVGIAILFTVRSQEGGAPWSVVEDVTFINNIIRHTAGGMNIHGFDDIFLSQQTRRILIKNNLFEDVDAGRWGVGCCGGWLRIANGTAEVVVDHNTGFQDGAIFHAPGGTAAISATAGAQAKFTFIWTSVNWIGARGPETGVARVFLDGVFVTEVDTFFTTEEVQAVVFTATGLADASHTLTIEVTGLKNSASTDTFIVMDAFDVTSSSSAPTETRFEETDPSIIYTPGLTQGNTSRAWSGSRRHTRFVYRNNLTLHGDSGVIGDGTTEGVNTLTTYFQGDLFERNVLVGGNESIYPPNNFFPASITDVGFVDLPHGNYRLASSSAYQNSGTDGKDIGADIDAIEAATEGVIDGVNNDSSPPTILPSLSTGPNGNGLHNTAVKVSWSVSDDESGIASSTGCDAVTLDTETGGTTLTCRATNGAGLSASESVTIRIDRTPPIVTASRTPAANSLGWNNTNVTVNLGSTDGADGSGVKELIYSASGAQPVASTTVADGSASISFTTEGVTTLTHFARDNAGNEEPARTLTVRIDKTSPEAYNQFNPATRDVAVFGQDALSGVPAGPVIPVSVVPGPADNREEDDGDERHKDEELLELRTYQVMDLAGNSLLLGEKVKRKDQKVQARIMSLQYHNGSGLSPPQNRETFEQEVK